MENKSIGGALVDVFDAGVSLVKSEITTLTRRVGNIAKAKGLGVVLLLAALTPLTLALIFLILFVFYGLERLGLGAWAAALIMGVVSLLVAGGLVFVALKKLGGDVPDDAAPSGPLSDIARDDLTYGAASSTAGAASKPTPVDSGPAPAAPVKSAGSGASHASSGQTSSGQTSSGQTSGGHTTGGHPVYEAPISTAVDTARVPHGGLQSTSTQGKPGAEPEQNGIPVSTNPTYRDDMKKEGY